MTQQQNLFAYRNESGDFELIKVVQYQSNSEENIAGVYRLGEIDEVHIGDSVYGSVDGGWAIEYKGSTDLSDQSMEEVAGVETGEKILNMLSQEESADIEEELKITDPRKTPDSSNAAIDCETGAKIRK